MSIVAGSVVGNIAACCPGLVTRIVGAANCVVTSGIASGAFAAGAGFIHRAEKPVVAGGAYRNEVRLASACAVAGVWIIALRGARVSAGCPVRQVMR